MSKIKLSIKDAQLLAKKKNGECLSTEYINSQIKMEWKCSEGHTWFMSYNSAQQRQWCPKCACKQSSFIRSFTIEHMHKLAQKKNGRCLSTKYKKSHTKLKWECQKGHIWWAQPANIQQGRWCPRCAKKQKSTIKEMYNLASQKGGSCLSTVYINTKTKLMWKCQIGHVWLATPDSIKKGCWCPKCSSGINERRCRLIFETLLNKKLPKVHPEWLRTAANKKLELDGYNEELKLAFEYQGIQHYKRNCTFFHKTNGTYEYSLQKDQEKRMKCKNNGITLIEIPYTVNLFEMKDFIIEELILNGFGKKIDFNAEIDFSKVSTTNEHKFFDRINKICHNRGGECLETCYITSTTKIQVKCKNGHIWAATPNGLKIGNWCPICSGVKKHTINDANDLAKSRCGICLSKEYKNNKTKLEWECSKKHTWIATFHDVQQGTWCPVCSRKDRQKLTN